MTNMSHDQAPSGETVRWLSREEQRAWRAYLNANRLLTDVIDQELQRDAGIPHTYYEILVRLSEAPGRHLRMSELADDTKTSRSRMSHAVARLEAMGWVRRDQCPTDRRGQVAVLTDEGFAALEAAAPGHVACVRAAFFDQLTPSQVTALREIGDAVVRHLGAAHDAG
jgi:DNA-binding MarR family transcriptional regulator